MALKLALVSSALMVLGVLVAQIRVAPPLVGFGIAVVGAAVGLAVLPGALIAWKRGKPKLPVLLLGVGWWLIPVFVVVSNRGNPRINDVTTDPEDPPQFVAQKNAAANEGRKMNYPAENAALQRTGYPELAPVQLSLEPAAALSKAKTAAESQGWKVVELAEADGRLEAEHQTGLFRFVDDVVVRVRPWGEGSVVDVRSKSRDGKGDLGKNAQRIQAFVAALGE